MLRVDGDLDDFSVERWDQHHLAHKRGLLRAVVVQLLACGDTFRNEGHSLLLFSPFQGRRRRENRRRYRHD